MHEEAKLKRFSTITTLLITVLLVVAAFDPPDMLIWLNLLSLGGLESTFLWVIILGVYWKKANATGALSSMVVGLGSYIIIHTFKLSPFGFHAIVPAVLLSLIAFLIGNLFGKNDRL